MVLPMGSARSSSRFWSTVTVGTAGSVSKSFLLSIFTAFCGAPSFAARPRYAASPGRKKLFRTVRLTYCDRRLSPGCLKMIILTPPWIGGSLKIPITRSVRQAPSGDEAKRDRLRKKCMVYEPGMNWGMINSHMGFPIQS